jgi:hypothetical protein
LYEVLIKFAAKKYEKIILPDYRIDRHFLSVIFSGENSLDRVV